MSLFEDYMIWRFLRQTKPQKSEEGDLSPSDKIGDKLHGFFDKIPLSAYLFLAALFTITGLFYNVPDEKIPLLTVLGGFTIPIIQTVIEIIRQIGMLLICAGIVFGIYNLINLF